MLTEWPLLICAAIETGFEQLRLQSQPEYERKYQLHNQVIAIKLNQLHFPLYFLFGKKIQVYSQYSGDIAVSLNVDALVLYQISEGANLTELIKQDKLIIDGNLSVLQEFSHYLQQNPFDFPEFISHYIGDISTAFLEKHVTESIKTGKKIISSSRQHINDLSTEEYKIIPNKMAFFYFSDQLEELKDNLTALEKRINQLQYKVKS